jgi:hypothetical protein
MVEIISPLKETKKKTKEKKRKALLTNTHVVVRKTHP